MSKLVREEMVASASDERNMYPSEVPTVATAAEVETYM